VHADPFERTLDNTIPQSAYSYIQSETIPPLDPAARECFRIFADCYVNARKLYAPLPKKSIGSGDQLIELWLRDAAPLYQAGDLSSVSDQRAVDEEMIIERFAESVVTSSSDWAGWTAFQLSNDVADGFKSRVTDWRQQLAESLSLLRGKISPISLGHDHRLTSHRDSNLRSALHAAESSERGPIINPEYRIEARKLGVDLETYALAYSYNWFRRGVGYGIRTRGTWAKFHHLRDGALVLPGNDVEDIDPNAYEVSWGRIIDGFIAVREVPRNPERVIDLLCGLREAVQDPRIEFGQRLVEAHARTDDHTSTRIVIRDAILDVLLSHHLPPVLRSSTARKKIVASIGKAATAGADATGGGVVVSVLGEAITLAVDAKPTRELEVRFRRRFRKQSLWKVYKIPGLDD
jgi:hypothetical protein